MVVQAVLFAVLDVQLAQIEKECVVSGWEYAVRVQRAVRLMDLEFYGLESGAVRAIRVEVVVHFLDAIPVAGTGVDLQDPPYPDVAGNVLVDVYLPQEHLVLAVCPLLVVVRNDVSVHPHYPLERVLVADLHVAQCPLELGGAVVEGVVGWRVVPSLGSVGGQGDVAAVDAVGDWDVEPLVPEPGVGVVDDQVDLGVKPDRAGPLGRGHGELHVVPGVVELGVVPAGGVEVVVIVPVERVLLTLDEVGEVPHHGNVPHRDGIGVLDPLPALVCCESEGQDARSRQF